MRIRDALRRDAPVRVGFLLANLLQALYGAVDLMVIGWYCPAKSVAAVSTGTQVTQIIASLITGFTMAGTILVFVSIACICNIAGDFFTVAVLHMGAAGTAFSTIASQAVSMFAAILYLNRRKFIFHFSLRTLRMDRKLLGELIRIGIPVSFQECMVRFSFLYLTSIMNGFGVAAASAVGIASKYDVFAMLLRSSQRAFRSLPDAAMIIWRCRFCSASTGT